MMALIMGICGGYLKDKKCVGLALFQHLKVGFVVYLLVYQG